VKNAFNINTVILIEMKEEKKNYVPPRIEIIVVQLENSLSASSATISPGTNNGEIKEQWGSESDKNWEVEW
jgi:hypothetical protein